MRAALPACMRQMNSGYGTPTYKIDVIMKWLEVEKVTYAA